MYHKILNLKSIRNTWKNWSRIEQQHSILRSWKGKFQQFGQAAAGIHSLSGTGLGLAISREFARIMGGDISITSELGRGSCFRFKINIRQGESEKEKERQPNRHVIGVRSGHEPLRILIVDDQEINRTVLSGMLDMKGFETREAVNGEEAVTMFTEWHPNFVIMDVRMPVMGGLEATKRIRSLEAGKTVPIIAVTASAFEHEKEEILEAGLTGHISKPFKLHEIYDKIKEYLEVEYVYDIGHR